MRAAGTNLLPRFRDAFPKQVTEGGAFKLLTKFSENHAEYHDWSFCARRLLTRTEGSFAGLLQWISKQVNEMKEGDVLESRERKTSARQTWTGSTRNRTRCWPSRPQTWHWPPLSHMKKLKSKRLSGGNAWNVNREDTIDIAWYFHACLHCRRSSLNGTHLPRTHLLAAVPVATGSPESQKKGGRWCLCHLVQQ